MTRLEKEVANVLKKLGIIWSYEKPVFVIVGNIADFKKTKSKNFKISCETGEGIDLLVDELFSLYELKE